MNTRSRTVLSATGLAAVASLAMAAATAVVGPEFGGNPYPLDTCPVSGEKLGAEAVTVVLSGMSDKTLDGTQVEEIVKTGTFTPPPSNGTNVEPPSGAAAATPLPEVVKPVPPKLPGFGSAAPAAA